METNNTETKRPTFVTGDTVFEIDSDSNSKENDGEEKKTEKEKSEADLPT